MCAVRQKYLCLKGGTHTDFYTAFATEELRATPPAVLCSVSLSITVYTKTRNPAALVFIPISAGRRAGMRIFMILWAFVFKNIAYPIVSSQADNRFFSKMVDRGAQTSNHLFL